MKRETIKMKMLTLNQMKDKDISKIGTAERDQYELELQNELKLPQAKLK